MRTATHGGCPYILQSMSGVRIIRLTPFCHLVLLLTLPLLLLLFCFLLPICFSNPEVLPIDMGLCEDNACRGNQTVVRFSSSHFPCCDGRRWRPDDHDAENEEHDDGTHHSEGSFDDSSKFGRTPNSRSPPSGDGMRRRPRGGLERQGGDSGGGAHGDVGQPILRNPQSSSGTLGSAAFEGDLQVPRGTSEDCRAKGRIRRERVLDVSQVEGWILTQRRPRLGSSDGDRVS